jgi:hypothetical protein
MMKQADYQMIADAVIGILDERGVTARQPTVTGRLASLYAATPQPRIDGRITIGEVLSYTAWVGFSSVAGFIAGVGSFAMARDINIVPLVWGLFTAGGASAVMLVSLADVVDLGGKIREVQLLRQFRHDYERFKEWQLEQRFGHPREVEHIVSVEVKDEHGNLRLFGFDGPQTRRVIQFARKWLEVGETTEKHYVGSGLIWSSNNKDGNMAGRAGFVALKQALFVNGLAYENDNGTWDMLASGRVMVEKVAALEIEDAPLL